MNREQWKNLHRAYRVLSLYNYDEGWEEFDEKVNKKLESLPDSVKTGPFRYPARGWLEQWGCYIVGPRESSHYAARRKYFLEAVKSAMYHNVRNVR